MGRIVVYHSTYGCATGCCGHTIDYPDGEAFTFDHPGDMDAPPGEKPLEFARRVITAELGAEHVADLDWSGCLLLDAGDAEVYRGEDY